MVVWRCGICLLMFNSISHLFAALCLCDFKLNTQREIVLFSISLHRPIISDAATRMWLMYISNEEKHKIETLGHLVSELSSNKFINLCVYSEQQQQHPYSHYLRNANRENSNEKFRSKEKIIQLGITMTDIERDEIYSAV